MGMTLPDLPQQKRRGGWKAAYEYLKANGPATVEEMFPGCTGADARNISAILRLRTGVFDRVGQTGHGNGGGQMVWRLRDNIDESLLPKGE